MESNKQNKGKQPLKLIENKQDRMIAFSKRRSGIYKKANELVTLCGVEVAVVVFSPAGRAYSFSHPSVEGVMGRFLGVPMPSNLPESDPHFMANQKKRVDELNKVHGELVDRVEVDKKIEKMTKNGAGGSGSQEIMWWEIPIEQLTRPQLQESNSRYIEILGMVKRKIEEKNKAKLASRN